MSRSIPGSRFFFAGCVVQVLTAIAHTAAQLQPTPPAVNDGERELVRLMQEQPLVLPGRTRTMMELFDGFGWWFSLSLAVCGLMGLTIRYMRPQDVGLTRAMAFWMQILTAVGVLISLRYWFIVPTSFIGTALILFTIAALRLQKVRASGA